MSLINELTKTLSGSALETLSGQLGTDPKTTNTAISAALPMIIGAMAKNASRPEGAQALNNALAKDHDGSILDNLGSFLGSSDNGAGPAILGHVLGQKQRQAQEGISQASGMDPAKAGQLLANLAPIVMGMLGKQQRGGGFDLGSLAGMLLQERQVAQKQAPSGIGGMLGSMLDADGDGNFLDDVGGILGGFLKR